MYDGDFESLLNTETGAMNPDEFKQFFEKLIEAVENHWEDYMVMTCSSDDIIVARICDECGCPRDDDRYYYSLSEGVVQAMNEEGEEEFLGVEDVFEAVNIEDCTCDAEVDELD